MLKENYVLQKFEMGKNHACENTQLELHYNEIVQAILNDRSMYNPIAGQNHKLNLA